jgi:uncharacterized membrane protein
MEVSMFKDFFEFNKKNFWGILLIGAIIEGLSILVGYAIDKSGGYIIGAIVGIIINFGIEICIFLLIATINDMTK